MILEQIEMLQAIGGCTKEAALLPGERSDFVPTKRLGYGWGIPETGSSVARE